MALLSILCQCTVASDCDDQRRIDIARHSIWKSLVAISVENLAYGDCRAAGTSSRTCSTGRGKTDSKHHPKKRHAPGSTLIDRLDPSVEDLVSMRRLRSTIDMLVSGLLRPAIRSPAVPAKILEAGRTPVSAAAGARLGGRVGDISSVYGCHGAPIQIQRCVDLRWHG